MVQLKRQVTAYRLFSDGLENQPRIEILYQFQKPRGRVETRSRTVEEFCFSTSVSPLPLLILISGRKFTAKSERDVIEGKTLLFSMKSSQAPGVERGWLATKGLVFVAAQCATLLHGSATHANDRPGEKGVLMSGPSPKCSSNTSMVYRMMRARVKRWRQMGDVAAT
ncbi:hypothetical protein XENOCAPTIV_016844 [Xenoophorus captivus]|uniref:Uncharacterized protein n=1 Tax=Xenoophorus captivus TaxID=1517983 RepID=A0ABV0RKY2_9TELE